MGVTLGIHIGFKLQGSPVSAMAVAVAVAVAVAMAMAMAMAMAIGYSQKAQAQAQSITHKAQRKPGCMMLLPAGIFPSVPFPFSRNGN
jgi:hypothetical protein